MRKIEFLRVIANQNNERIWFVFYLIIGDYKIKIIPETNATTLFKIYKDKTEIDIVPFDNPNGLYLPAKFGGDSATIETKKKKSEIKDITRRFFQVAVAGKEIILKRLEDYKIEDWLIKEYTKEL